MNLDGALEYAAEVSARVERRRLAVEILKGDGKNISRLIPKGMLLDEMPAKEVAKVLSRAALLLAESLIAVEKGG